MGIDVQSFAVANLRRRPEAVEIGGFVAGFDPATTSPYINYATPLPAAEPTDADVAALIAAFRARGLKPRLEFAPDAAPTVEPALRAAGFTTEEEHEYLVCTPETLKFPDVAAPYVKQLVEAPTTDEDYLTIAATVTEAFTGRYVSNAQDAARSRRMQETGGAVRFVRAPDGSCAGAGSCSAPAVGTCELSGVATRPQLRGRGIAAAVTAALAGAMFAQGAESVWLEFSGDGSRRVYERVGFRPQGSRLYMSIEG